MGHWSSYIANTTCVDGLATRVARTSAAVVLKVLNTTWVKNIYNPLQKHIDKTEEMC